MTRTGLAFGALAGTTDAYGYNGRSEVVSVRRDLGGEEVRGFGYDPIGYRLSATEYAESGDALGNMTSDGCFRYTWNAENRLVRAQELCAPTNRHPYTVSYAYDHRGRMVKSDNRDDAECERPEMEDGEAQDHFADEDANGQDTTSDNQNDNQAGTGSRKAFLVLIFVLLGVLGGVGTGIPSNSPNPGYSF